MKTTNQLCFIGVESPLSVGPMLGQCQHANNDVLPLPNVGPTIGFFFSRTTDPISTKLVTTHPSEKGIQGFFFKRSRGHAHFQRGIITKTHKYIDEILIIYFSRNTVPISTKHDMEHF